MSLKNLQLDILGKQIDIFLASLNLGGDIVIRKHSIYDTDLHFQIDAKTRDIINPSQDKKVIMQGDHNSERFTFELPRRVDGHDMSLCNSVQIHYINIDSRTRETNIGIYDVQDLQPDPPDNDNVVIFSWLISSNVTRFVGAVSFVIRFACVTDGVVEYAWHTNINKSINISTSLINSNVVVQEYIDILEQWRNELIKSTPIAKVEETSEGATITVKDKDGETKVVIKHGKNGISGSDGYSPSISLNNVDDGVEITVRNKTGTQTAKVQNGIVDMKMIDHVKDDLNLQKQFRNDYITNLRKRIDDLETSSGYTKVNLTTNQKFNGLIPASVTKVVFTNIKAPEDINLQDASLDQDMSVVYWITNDVMYVSSQDIKKRIMAPPISSKLFYAKVNLKQIIFDNFDTSNCTSLRGLFDGCQNLEWLDLTNFNTINISNMSHMFSKCSKLKYLNISNFNTSNTTEMRSMFQLCSELSSLDVNNFDTSKVTDMSFMFNYCKAISSLDLSNFDTSKVTDMSTMFQRCQNLVDLRINNFNTNNVTNMSFMFHGCQKLRSLDLSNFNTSNVTGMTSMFSYCTLLEKLDLSNFNTSNVTDMSRMFQHCENLVDLRIDNFSTNNVTNMSFMFNECHKLTSLDLSNFDANKVTDTRAMFQYCYKLSKFPYPKNLNRIDSCMYNHLSGVKDDTAMIPATVKSINFSHIFYNCGLNNVFKRITVEDGNEILKEVSGVLFSKDGTILYAIPRALQVHDRTYCMPEGVTQMAILSFSRVHTFDKLILPNSYEIIRFTKDNSGDVDPVEGNSLNCAIYVFTTVNDYEVKEDNQRYSSYEGCIYSKDGHELISVPVKYKGVLNIRDGCITIGQEAFWVQRIKYFDQISSINIPASVTTIEKQQLVALNNISANVTINIDPDNLNYKIVDSKIVEKIA